MKRFAFAFVAASLTVLSCTSDPRIVPDPFDASTNDISSSSSSSSSSASSSSSSGSSSSGGPQGDGSGARLKRHVYASGDGLVAGHSDIFYDALLGVACVPRDTPKGFRCVAFEPSFAAGRFADALCSVPVVISPKTCAAAPYYTITVGVTCNRTIGVQAFGVTPSATQTLFYKSGNNCVSVPPDQLDVIDIYDIGPEVDYTQFAAMTLEHE